MKASAVVVENNKVVLTIDEVINRYELSNRADGKSPKTIAWYRDILNQFSAYLKTERYPCHLSAISLDIVRGYVLYLRHKPKFKGHPFTPTQADYLSPRTVQCHVRALNALKLFFSRLAKTSGVYRLHAHLCRHTFAINYLIDNPDDQH